MTMAEARKPGHTPHSWRQRRAHTSDRRRPNGFGTLYRYLKNSTKLLVNFTF